jgi:hypothetical protein
MRKYYSVLINVSEQVNTRSKSICGPFDPDVSDPSWGESRLARRRDLRGYFELDR